MGLAIRERPPPLLDISSVAVAINIIAEHVAFIRQVLTPASQTR